MINKYLDKSNTCTAESAWALAGGRLLYLRFKDFKTLWLFHIVRYQIQIIFPKKRKPFGAMAYRIHVKTCKKYHFYATWYSPGQNLGGPENLNFTEEQPPPFQHALSRKKTFSTIIINYKILDQKLLNTLNISVANTCRVYFIV